MLNIIVHVADHYDLSQKLLGHYNKIESILLPDGTYLSAIEPSNTVCRSVLENTKGVEILPHPSSARPIGPAAAHFQHLKNPPKETDASYSAYLSLYEEVKHPMFHPDA